MQGDWAAPAWKTADSAAWANTYLERQTGTSPAGWWRTRTHLHSSVVPVCCACSAGRCCSAWPWSHDLHKHSVLVRGLSESAAHDATDIMGAADLRKWRFPRPPPCCGWCTLAAAGSPCKVRPFYHFGEFCQIGRTTSVYYAFVNHAVKHQSSAKIFSNLSSTQVESETEVGQFLLKIVHKTQTLVCKLTLST